MAKKINVDSYQGYCVSCKTKQHFQGEILINPEGRRVAKGECPTCGVGIERILGRR